MRAVCIATVALVSSLACGPSGHDHGRHATSDRVAHAHDDATTHAVHDDLGTHSHNDHADHSRHHDHGAMLLTRPSSIVRLGLLDAPRIGPQALRLQVLRPDGQALTGLRRAPELQLVVYVVRSDLTSFARLEAVPRDGAFVINPTLEAGRYHLYGTTDSEDYDFQLAPASFDLGSVPAPTALPPFTAAQVAGDVSATLALDPLPLRAGDLNGELSFSLGTAAEGGAASLAAAPLTDLDPMRDGYLDALIVGADMTTLSLVHTHGRTPIPGQPSRPSIKFHTRVAAGNQRLFVVVQRHGTPLTFAWTLAVSPAPNAP